MDIKGLCHICGKEAAAVCRLCGRPACTEHMKNGICASHRKT